MKKAFFFISLTLFFGTLLAQTPSLIISNADRNIMYRNYPNRFYIAAPGAPNAKLIVSATGATVQQQGNIWLVSPDSTARQVTISASATINGKQHSFGTQTFRVMELQAPEAFLSVSDRTYASGDFIPLSNLMHTSATLIANYGPNVLLQLPFKITSFTMILNGIHLKSQGANFTEEQLDRIKNIRSGSVIVFADICTKTPNGKTLRLKPLILNVK